MLFKLSFLITLKENEQQIKSEEELSFSPQVIVKKKKKIYNMQLYNNAGKYRVRWLGFLHKS